jgi:hypothetical protein
MIQIEIRAPKIDGQRVEWAAIASLQVDGSNYELNDPTGVIDLSLPAPDLRSGHTLQFQADPEGWARNLPAVYRGPELVAAVVHDDSPALLEDVRVERESVVVPETAPARLAAAH